MATYKQAHSLALKHGRKRGFNRAIPISSGKAGYVFRVYKAGTFEGENVTIPKSKAKKQRRNPEIDIGSDNKGRTRVNPTHSKGIGLMRSAFSAASKTKDRRLLQARVSYAQGVSDALRSCNAISVSQAKVYIDGLRSLLR